MSALVPAGIRVARLPFGDELWALRTPTLPPASTTNTVILGARQLVVIEPATPYEDERARLELALAQRVAAGARVVAICLTHHHVDHIGAALALAARFGAPICAHPETATRLPFAVDETIDGDWSCELDDGRRVEALHTPGHAPGHVVFFERRARIFYVGDMVAGEGTILIDPDDDGDMRRYLASLEQLRATFANVAGEIMIPSHGPVLTDPLATIAYYIDHRLKREAKIVAALGSSAADLESLLVRSYDDVAPSLRGLARRSLRAHLDKLVTDGRVRRQGEQIELVMSASD